MYYILDSKEKELKIMGKILKYMTTIALAAVMLFGAMTTAFAVEYSGLVVGNDQLGSVTSH